MIELISTDPYSQKKYKDDFGSKPNPFRFVALARAHLPNGSSIDIVLKFSSRPSEKQVIEKGLQLLQDVGIAGGPCQVRV